MYGNKIKDALMGLYEVLNLSLEPDNILYQCGLENLEGLRCSLIDLLINDYNTVELLNALLTTKFDGEKTVFYKPPDKKESNAKKEEEKSK